jgi:competence protein ComEC
MKILDFPLTKISFCFVAGILLAHYWLPSFGLLVCFSVVFFLLFIGSYFLVSKRKIETYFFGISTWVLSFLIGIASVFIHNNRFEKDNYSNKIKDFEKQHQIELVLREKLKTSNQNYRFIAVVKKIDYKICTGKLLLNINKDSLNHSFFIGKNLKVSSNLIRNKTPKNPGQFNYSKYLENKSIFAQVYASGNEIKTGSEIDKDIWYYSDKIRQRIITNLEKNNFSKSELAVTIALLLGQQQDITQDVLQDYQLAGAVHILSVSGLHVGFILLFINLLLQRLPKTKLNLYLKLFITIFSLWGFAIIAGLSPSVVRSAAMFSIVAIGMFLNRKTNIFHTLLVSMLLILFFQPSFLFDVGFQLSYLALFFILWLQPLLSNIWLPKSKIVKYFWDILTVSFAAQIGAFPLSIYYFHQFPGLFFITNLIVIPFLILVMGWGVFVMLWAFFGSVPIAFTQILEALIRFMNWIIHWVASFENFIIKDISINYNMLLCSYLFIVAAIVWFKKPNFHKLFFALASLFVFQICYFGSIWKNEQNKELIVFNSKRNTIITAKNGSELTVFANDSILKKASSNSLLKSYRVENFCDISKKEILGNVLFFNQKKLLILDETAAYANCNPDVLVIRNSPKINLERLLLDLKPKVIVADASNFKTYVKRWQATCEELKIPFHATAEKGFYRLDN